ncbi:acetate kinase [Candidatus Bathyarchaeota archaeon]|nr:MAG: acetate kinase [Candidatus Bathyarchaeota archaeon]
MKILVINCGSSSIKYSLIDIESEETLVQGIVEKIGEEHSIFRQRVLGREVERRVKVRNHKDGLKLILDSLKSPSTGVIRDQSEISAVGHRVVHGGSDFVESTVIDDKVIETIRKYSSLAPLHNPPNLTGITILRELLPGIPHVAVFDTAFHQTMPEVAYLYPIPYEYYEKYGVRRYGFHGVSHRYVSQRAAEILGRDIRELKIITCHLGNGCSITAVDRGRSVDTSMGFTPLEGVPMGTRSGDIDPSIIQFLAEVENLTLNEIYEILNKRSGLLGLSGVSNDVREIKKAADSGDHRAEIALEILAYRVKKYIGAYAAVMGGVDAIVFTAGIGENAHYIRSKICEGLEFLGVILDEDRNRNPAEWNGVISAENSRVKVLVVPTREDLIIAKETLEAVTKAEERRKT